jgi:hypothetical protein
MRAGIFFGAVLLSPAAWAGTTMERLPLECDPSFGSWATDSYSDSRGPQYAWVGDAFPGCITPEFWNGIGNQRVEETFTIRDRGLITSDGTSVTLLVEMELDLPDGVDGRLGVDAGADGLFHAPPPGGPGSGRAPAKLVFEIERMGVLPEGHVSGRVTGPGVDLRPDLDALPDGVHEFAALLEPGATYDVDLYAAGLLETNATLSQRVTFSVLAPEPAAALLLLAGAAAFGLRSVLDAHRVRARRREVRRGA